MNPKYQLSLNRRHLAPVIANLLLALTIGGFAIAEPGSDRNTLNRPADEVGDFDRLQPTQQTQIMTEKPIIGGPQVTNSLKEQAASQDLDRKPIVAHSTNEVFYVRVKKGDLSERFLGRWDVEGKRIAVEALPQFQSHAEQAFAVTTFMYWEFRPFDPKKTKVATACMSGNKLMINRSRPIRRTVADELIELELPLSGSFSATQQVTITENKSSQVCASERSSGSALRAVAA